MVGKEQILKFEEVEKQMLKSQFPVGQQSGVEGWMVDFILERMTWMMMMRKFHYQILQLFSLPVSF